MLIFRLYSTNNLSVEVKGQMDGHIYAYALTAQHWLPTLTDIDPASRALQGAHAQDFSEAGLSLLDL